MSPDENVELIADNCKTEDSAIVDGDCESTINVEWDDCSVFDGMLINIDELKSENRTDEEVL